MVEVSDGVNIAMGMTTAQRTFSEVAEYCRIDVVAEVRKIDRVQAQRGGHRSHGTDSAVKRSERCGAQKITNMHRREEECTVLNNGRCDRMEVMEVEGKLTYWTEMGRGQVQNLREEAQRNIRCTDVRGKCISPMRSVAEISVLCKARIDECVVRNNYQP